MSRLVIGNWKMNPASLDEGVALARAAAGDARGSVQVGVAPPAVMLPAVAAALSGSGVLVLAQDVHWETKGAYTGQHSATLLAPFARAAIVGHSEVRRDQGDDDARVAAKLRAALGAGLDAVACVGETAAENERGSTEEVLRRQAGALAGALAGPGPGRLLAVAYEPVWAIGTGRPATAAHASSAARLVREVLGRDDLLVLYGGSVTAAGVAEFAGAEGIDGALVGGASLRADEFARIVRAFA